MPLWHYTTGDCLKRIIRDGEIRPATGLVPDGERPIVWFSRREDWEPTATKTLRGLDGTTRQATMDEMEQLGGGLARIGVLPDTAPYEWLRLKRLSGMSGGQARRLEKAALENRRRSCPADWRGSFDPVPQSKWVAVEVLAHGKWVPARIWRS